MSSESTKGIGHSFNSYDTSTENIIFYVIIVVSLDINIITVDFDLEILASGFKDPKLNQQIQELTMRGLRVLEYLGISNTIDL